jgi:hypothetical protein
MLRACGWPDALVLPRVGPVNVASMAGSGHMRRERS